MAARRLITLDALGTLLELLPPAPRLVDELRARGVEVGEAQASAALRAEIAFYRAHHDSARDASTLALLRDRCTGVLHDALNDAGAALGALPRADLRDALLAALRFAGHRLVVVSNWDVSLHDALHDSGLAALVDAAISSAEAGAAKPDPRIFARALALAGGDGGGAMHVGDSLRFDVAGALAAGFDAVLVV